MARGKINVMIHGWFPAYTFFTGSAFHASREMTLLPDYSALTLLLCPGEVDPNPYQS